MPTFVVYGGKNSDQKNSALVSGAGVTNAATAIAAAVALGVRDDVDLTAVQIQAGDLSEPDVAFYGAPIGAAGNGTWPDQPRGE